MGIASLLEEYVVRPIKKASEHPLLVGLAAGGVDVLLNGQEVLGVKIDSENAFLCGVGAYSLFALLRRYVFSGENHFETRSRTKIERLEDRVENNKEVVALAIGGGAYALTPEVRDANYPALYFGLMTILSNMTLAVRKASREIKTSYKAKSFEERLWNFALEHPSVFALALSVPLAVQRYSSLLNLTKNQKDAVMLTIPGVAAAYLAVYSTALIASTVLHTSRTQRAKTYGNLEDTMRIENPRQRAIAQQAYAEEAFKNGDLKKAIEAYRVSLKSYKNPRRNKTPFEFLLSLLNYYEIKRVARGIKFELKKEHSLGEVVARIHSEYISGSIEKTAELVDEHFEVLTRNLFSLAYLSSLYDVIGVDSAGFWIEAMKARVDGGFHPLNEFSKNLLVPDDDVLSKCILVKTNDNKEEIDREAGKTELVWEAVKDESKVPKIIAIVDDDGSKSIILSNANARVLTAEEYGEHLDDVIETVAEFHKRMRTANLDGRLPNFDFKAQAIRALGGMGFDEEYIQSFLGVYVPEMESGLPRYGPTHDDMHPGNILFCRFSGGYSIIDFEYVANGNPAIDVFSLLENNMYPVADPEKGVKLYNLLNHFVSLGEFEKFYFYASLHKCLRLSGITSARHASPKFVKDSERNLLAARHYLGKLKARASELNRSSALREKLVGVAEYWEARHQ